MENSVPEFDRLKTLIKLEKDNYAEAIKNNHELNEVKDLFLKIKKLEREASLLMLQRPSEKPGPYTAKEEIRYLNIKKDFIRKTLAYIDAIENLVLEDLFDPVTYCKVASLHYQSVLAGANMNSIVHDHIANNKQYITETIAIKLK